ncbi:methylase involved in ubiquinone/menaquinone biosynthesis [Xenococcus sp. PCC 7305]|uniref:class I SAM-dependent methyltransferase n=1 Tax=Xenococcus sp. PCC 7305 TaxID=102125 RepID=UPI0002AC6361|nr:class I SAM-dependent methyltransferase [Xenococcus sp. PCC 7305]ELS02154.1 methylase involved in ubiquinone/menaquinone biosynthesis [Xenococcus sp. PCC 7305]
MSKIALERIVKSQLTDQQFKLLRQVYWLGFSLYNKLYSWILGKHPRNTIFSFNFHNINHINKFLRKVISQITNNQNYIVDVGAGNSPYYEYFTGKIARYIAIDRFTSLANDDERQIEKLSGYAENLPLENETADIVLCNQVLEHVNDPIKATTEIYRILKPDGLFIGSVPHVSPIHLEPYDFRRYTDLGIKKLLENAGFVDIKIEGNGGVYSTVAVILAMDWMLSTRQENKSQNLFRFRALLLAPLVGFLNAIAIILDRFLGDKQRTPANLCWRATKPL